MQQSRYAAARLYSRRKKREEMGSAGAEVGSWEFLRVRRWPLDLEWTRPVRPKLNSTDSVTINFKIGDFIIYKFKIFKEIKKLE
jgi:hypothetical protein